MKYLSSPVYVLGVVLLLAFWPSSASAQNSQQLWQAAFDGDLQTVKSAVEHGANANVKGRGGFSAVLAASRNGHLEIVKYLVEHGADINQRDNSRDKTPLTAAAFKGHADIVKYLLDKGAEVNDQSINGWTALHDAAYIGNFDAVKALVDHNANLHIRNERHETPLETAERGSRDAVQRGQTNATPEDYRAVIDYLKSHGG